VKGLPSVAKRFPGESSTFRCRKGKVNIYIPKTAVYGGSAPAPGLTEGPP
jgi:hypothetical protein